MFKKTDKNESKDIELVLLKTVNNNVEFDITKSILEDNDIPYIIKDEGIGGYMRIISGDSIFKTDILVERTAYDDAKELLDQITFIETEE